MSTTIFIPPGAIIAQPDFTASQEDNGGWRGSQSFLVKKGDLDSASVRLYFRRGRPITDLDPNSDAIWSFLRIRRITPQTEPGGWTRIVVDLQGYALAEYPGAPTDADESFITYAMRGQAAETELAKHPKWKALTETERNALGKLIAGEMQWGPDWLNPGAFVFSYPQQASGAINIITPNPITSADGINFANRITEGVTTYRRATYEWTKRWSSLSGIRASEIAAIGKITSNPPGNPPTPGTDRDFMLVAANQEQVGEADANPTFTNELVFEMSDDGGFDSFLQS